jgi:fused signal recognition particle receptor
MADWVWIVIAVVALIAIIGVIAGVTAHRRAQQNNAHTANNAHTVHNVEQQEQQKQKKQAQTPSQPSAQPQSNAHPHQPASSPKPAQSAPSAPSPSSAQQSATQQLAAPEKSASRLVRLRSRLAHSRNPFGATLLRILSRDTLSEEDWEDVEDTLLMADVGADVSEHIVSQLRSDSRVTGQHDPQQIRALLRDQLLDAIGRDTDRQLEALKPSAQGKLSVIMMVGVNGTGKTTTAGKLGRLFVAEGKKVVMAAADTFRAAAAEQLETWAHQSGITVVRADHDGADPASVAFDAAHQAKESGADVLIVDTAGRLQNKRNLMDQLGKIRRVIEKTTPVGEVLLVLDATTGQNGMEQARVFAQAIGITGIVLTKLDGSAKGGIVLSVQNALKVPVKLVGLGEGPDDLAVFDPATFVDGILGDRN